MQRSYEITRTAEALFGESIIQDCYIEYEKPQFSLEQVFRNIENESDPLTGIYVFTVIFNNGKTFEIDLTNPEEFGVFGDEEKTIKR